MRTRMYGGVRGRKTKVGGKPTFVFLLLDSGHGFCGGSVTFLEVSVTMVGFLVGIVTDLGDFVTLLVYCGGSVTFLVVSVTMQVILA